MLVSFCLFLFFSFLLSSSFFLILLSLGQGCSYIFWICMIKLCLFFSLLHSEKRKSLKAANLKAQLRNAHVLKQPLQGFLWPAALCNTDLFHMHINTLCSCAQLSMHTQQLFIQVPQKHMWSMWKHVRSICHMHYGMCTLCVMDCMVIRSYCSSVI